MGHGRRKGGLKPARNDSRRPVVIIPGLASSGLRVEQSLDFPAWTDQRVWVSPAAMAQGTVNRLAGACGQYEDLGLNHAGRV